MKKILYIFLLAAAIVFISGRIQSSQNALTENNTKLSAVNESKADTKSASSETTSKIQFMLKGEKGQKPALWWSYNEKNKEGC